MKDGSYPDSGGTTKRKAHGKGVQRSELSPVTGTIQRHSSEAVQPRSSTKGKGPADKGRARVTSSAAKTKSHVKGKRGATSATTREIKLEEREVFSLRLPSTVVTKFTSVSDLKSVKESFSHLTSCTETVEVARPVRKTSTLPVASLSHSNFSSRSSRTTLMLARGGKDPYDQIKQLPARAFNTHDFMTLIPCKNVVRISDNAITSLQNDVDLKERSVRAGSVSETKSVARIKFIREENVGQRMTLSESSTKVEGATPKRATLPSDDACSDSLICPVAVSTAMSIEGYIEQRKRQSMFNKMDCVLARDIHGLVSKGHELGVLVARLQVGHSGRVFGRDVRDV